MKTRLRTASSLGNHAESSLHLRDFRKSKKNKNYAMLKESPDQSFPTFLNPNFHIL